MRKIEVSQSGNLLVFQKGYTPEFVFDAIQKHGLKGLRIFAHLKGQRMADVSFLEDYSFLEALDVTSLDDYDFGFLKKLPNLKKLSINTEGKREIDLSGQTGLEYLAIQWREGKIRGLERCQKLSTICLVEYKEEDFSPISVLRQLTVLKVKTSTIKTTNGLTKLRSLESIFLGNCKRLRSIRAIAGLKNLRNLEIILCPRIIDYDELTDLPSLENLKLVDSKDIKSIDFIEHFPSLTKILLTGTTNVLDGNLLPTQRVKERLYPNRKHYNVKMRQNEVG